MNGTSLPPSSLRNAGPGQERGFALLTVIVIVMALTILGLSLFSLSSFEARFFRPAVNQAQAVQSGRAGVDWARYVLESTDDLDSVRIATPPDGISGVIARRGTDFEGSDSTGYVFPPPGVDPEPIWVRAVASQGNQESAVLAKFSPNAGQDLYKRLITVIDRIVIEDDNGECFGNTLLYGNIWMGDVRIEDWDGENFGNSINPATLKGINCISEVALPRPELDLDGTWWNEKYAAAEDLPASGSFSIGAPGSASRIYRTNGGETQGNRRWSAVLEGSECTVNVRGTSVWLLPEGLHCDKQLRFHNVGPDKATVIMVAKPGPLLDPGGSKLEQDVGFALLGGVNFESNVRVFMISSGCVEIEHHLDAMSDAGSAKYLSIYADWAKFLGPESGSEDMTLEHGLACNAYVEEDAKDHLVDQLIEANLLPNSRFARRKLAFVPGTWNENPITVGN